MSTDVPKQIQTHFGLKKLIELSKNKIFVINLSFTNPNKSFTNINFKKNYINKLFLYAPF